MSGLSLNNGMDLQSRLNPKSGWNEFNLKSERNGLIQNPYCIF